MELINFDDYILKYNFPLAVTIGSFDGIHIGHQELIKTTKSIAKNKSYKSAVITFDPHPLTVLKNEERSNISSLLEKFEIIEKFNIDFLIIINFNDEFSKISKSCFVEEYLLKINVKEVIVGDDFKFGYLGEGKANDISILSNNLIKTNIISILKVDDEKVGSTKIIKLLNEGRIEEVNRLLGYNYYFAGNVIEGKKIGRKLGFPTANINNDSIKKLLKTGVYGVKVIVDNEIYLGMMNIGHNPTCNYTNHISIEINLFDVSINLYNKNLKIEVFCFIRDEQKFKNIEELIQQLTLDKENIINKNLILAKK